MSSPNDNTSPHARVFYGNPVARRRQLSSGPLGRKSDSLQIQNEILAALHNNAT
jgi:hypothetical protein